MVVTVITVLILFPLAHARARILFQDDSWHRIDSTGLFIDADGSATDTEIKFGFNGALIRHDNNDSQFEIDPDAPETEAPETEVPEESTTDEFGGTVHETDEFGGEIYDPSTDQKWEKPLPLGQRLID